MPVKSLSADKYVGLCFVNSITLYSYEFSLPSPKYAQDICLSSPAPSFCSPCGLYFPVCLCLLSEPPPPFPHSRPSVSHTQTHTHPSYVTLGFGQERWSLNSLYETVKENSICYTFSSQALTYLPMNTVDVLWLDPRDLIIVSNIVTIGIFYLIQTTASLRIQNATFVNWKIARATKM